MKNQKALPAKLLRSRLSHAATRALPVVLALVSPLSFAQQQAEPEARTVIVTANRAARTVDETLVPVTIITRKDIERLQAQSVADVLKGMPGVSLANNGGLGKATSLFVRGTNSDHVLVLVDGFKIGSATTGTASLQDIPIDQVERIELVRGPRASIYGSEAIGGVLQIFTRKGAQAPGFALTGGSRHTFGASAQAGVGDKDLWASAGVQRTNTRGIDACQGNTSKGCFANQPDRDGYEQTSFNLHGGMRVGEKLGVELIALQADGRNEFDGTTQDISDGRQQLFGSVLNFTPVDAWLSTLRLGQTTDDLRSYLGELFKSRFTTRRDALTWQNNVEIAKGQDIVLGVDLMRDKVMSTTAYDTTSRSNKAAFGQYLFNDGAFNAELSARHDDNEQFGSHNTGGIAAGYALSRWFGLSASYATAFKAPTFNQLYFPGFGSPNLKPETSRNRELDMKGDLGRGKWQLSFFDNHIDNLIASNPSTFLAENISRAVIRGAELSVSQKWGQTSLAANATVQNPEDHSGTASDGNVLARRPRQTARLDADQDIGAWSIGTSWTGVGRRFDDAANKTHLGGYSLWDLRAEYRFDKDWRVQLRGENVFDKRYETAYLFNQLGAGVFLTLRYQPK